MVLSQTASWNHLDWNWSWKTNWQHVVVNEDSLVEREKERATVVRFGLVTGCPLRGQNEMRWQEVLAEMCVH